MRVEESDTGTAQTIGMKLLESLRETLPQSENSDFVLAARIGRVKLIGGITCSTSYGWLLVKTLWVDSDHRNKGVGRELMEQAESKGKSVGCHSAWLDTSNPTAMRFYESLGYDVFGKLSNSLNQYPESHERWFMKKALK